MIPEKVFHKILALGEVWRVSAVDYVEKERQVNIRVMETAQLWAGESCPHCKGKSVGGYDHAPERRWRHLNVSSWNRRSWLAAARSQWGHSITRLFTLLRAALWQRWEWRGLLESCGTAGGGGRFSGTLDQAYLPGLH